MSNKIIQVKNLKKYFSNVKAVDDISFSVEKGELFAFLGVNGAGKSTTISMICGTLKQDSGEIVIDNKNIDNNKDEILNKIGVVFQNSVLDAQLSVWDNLFVRASLYNIPSDKAKQKIEELANVLDFKDLLNRSVGKLSGGQKRKIDIARALLNEPTILILDEPTTGLDPQTRKTMWEIISLYRKNTNMTVFLTTHYMEETSEADHIVILDKGKIVASGTPLELKNKYTGDFITLYNTTEEDVKSLKIKYKKVGTNYQIEVKNTEEAKNLIIKNPNIFVDFEIVKGKMDDVFLSATGKQLTEEN